MKQRGFTLIELLAVIVILSIISFIAIPIVLGIIEDAKKSATLTSTYVYISSLEFNNYMAVFNSNYEKVEENKDVNISTINIKLEGTNPTQGTVFIEDGMVKKANLCVNDYNVVYDGEIAVINGKCEKISAGAVKFQPAASDWDITTVEDALNSLYE